MSIKSEITAAAARAAYVQAWSSWMDQEGYSTRHGVDRMDQAPATPPAAKKWGRDLVKAMEKLNGKKIERIYVAADEADGGNANPEDFGHYTAMQALGHGVSWSDLHESHGFLVPSGEAYCVSAKGFEGYVSERFPSRG